MSNVTVIATEVWNTRKGQVVKAVARTASGQIVGATNQTAAVKPVLVGRK
jgi:hypothetical protein